MTALPALDPADLQQARERAGAVLRDGGLVAAPTDTVYGLLADVTNPDAVARLRAVRGAPHDVPPAVLLHNARSVAAIAARVPVAAERLIAAYWPGAVTLVLSASPELGWALGAAGDVVAVRLPAEPVLLQILHDVGPLACSAAAPVGSPPPTTADGVTDLLGDGVDLYVDGGPRAGPASTIVDVRGEAPVVLRAGGVDAADVTLVAGGSLGWGERPPATAR